MLKKLLKGLLQKNPVRHFWRNRRQKYRWKPWRNPSINFCGIPGGVSEGTLERTPGYASGGIRRKKISCNFLRDLYTKIPYLLSGEISEGNPAETINKNPGGIP